MVRHTPEMAQSAEDAIRALPLEGSFLLSAKVTFNSLWLFFSGDCPRYLQKQTGISNIYHSQGEFKCYQIYRQVQ